MSKRSNAAKKQTTSNLIAIVKSGSLSAASAEYELKQRDKKGAKS